MTKKNCLRDNYHETNIAQLLMKMTWGSAYNESDMKQKGAKQLIVFTMNTHRSQSSMDISRFRPHLLCRMVNFDNNSMDRTNHSFCWTHICMRQVCSVFVVAVNHFGRTILCPGAIKCVRWISNRSVSFQFPANMVIARISTSNH